MRLLTTTLALVAMVLGGTARALEPGSPEDTLMRYLAAMKADRFDEVYELSSKTLRGGKDKEAFVKEMKAMMSVADVKIFDFTVSPGKIEGDKARVPNVLESQDKFVNTLGLTEHELYTLVREDGEWKVDSQLLLEPAEIPKWFPQKQKSDAATPPSH